MTKLGAHVNTGGRTGYGPFCEEAPALVVAVDEGGALLEAKEKSNGRTVTVFRDTSVYREAPPGIDNPDVEIEWLVERYWPQLRAKWAENPADFYQITNEQGGGGDDLMAVRRVVAYERAVMQRANAEGFPVVVLNLASGSPDIVTWRDEMAPLIAEAWRAGNAYGRHVYGRPYLVDEYGEVMAGETFRPFEEVAYLNGVLRVTGQLLVTEIGLHSGFDYESVERHTSQMVDYDAAAREVNDIVGLAQWTLGQWGTGTPQWNDAIPALIDYMGTVETPPWEPLDFSPGPRHNEAYPREPFVRRYWACHWEMTEEQRIEAYIEAARANVTIGPSFDDAGMGAVGPGVGPNGEDGLLAKYVTMWNIPEGAEEAFESFYDDYYESTEIEGYRQTSDLSPPPPDPDAFRLTHWPTPHKVINQLFGANPQNYEPFGLPGHEGTDIRAWHGDPIFAAHSGTVARVHTDPSTHNYGIHVRVTAPDGINQTIYAHLVSASVEVGQQVAGGQEIGLADDTGNSFGSHLHFSYKRLGEWYTDELGNAWPYNIHNSDEILYLLAPEAYDEPPAEWVYQGPAVSAFVRGLDNPASDWRWPDAKSAFDRTGLIPKFHSHGTNRERWQDYHGGGFNLVRIVIDRGFTDRRVSAIFTEVAEQIRNFWDLGARDYIMLNEPNTPHESLGRLWDTPEEFGQTFDGVCRLVKDTFPGIRIWFPGLSPGGDDTTPYGEKPYHDFLNRARGAGALTEVYGMVQHVYTGITTDWTVASDRMVGEVMDYRRRYCQYRPLVIGEFSVNRPAGPDYKAVVYNDFFSRLEGLPGVQAAYAFTSDWYGTDPHKEGWVEHGIDVAYENLLSV